jgi:PBP1b-binding outer membrane lipoprotein LpoB
MKRIVSILCTVWLLNGCTSQFDSSQAANAAVECPTPTGASLPLIKTSKDDVDFYNNFDFTSATLLSMLIRSSFRHRKIILFSAEVITLGQFSQEQLKVSYCHRKIMQK